MREEMLKIDCLFKTNAQRALELQHFTIELTVISDIITLATSGSIIIIIIIIIIQQSYFDCRYSIVEAWGVRSGHDSNRNCTL